MPIYEYHCEKCNIKFETLVFGGDTPICPTCNGEDITRLMSSCGFVSKGAGGETVRRTAADSSCGGCSANSCAGCGH